MRIRRHFTTKKKSPYESFQFHVTSSEIKNPDGSIVFKLESFEVPSHWSNVACDVLAQKYFRRAGVPEKLKRIEEEDEAGGTGPRPGRKAVARRSEGHKAAVRVNPLKVEGKSQSWNDSLKLPQGGWDARVHKLSVSFVGALEDISMQSA